MNEQNSNQNWQNAGPAPQQGASPEQNKRVEGLLRSPQHANISDRILLITFTGRKSGKQYSTPISYMRDGEELIGFTDSPWWRNLEGGAQVSLVLQGQEVQAYAEAIKDPQQVAEGLRRLARKDPDDAPYFGVTFDADGQPNEAHLQHAAQSNAKLRMKLLGDA